MIRAQAPDAAWDEMLGEVLDRTLVCRLYVNDKAPSSRDRATDYREASFPGYRPRPLVRADWTLADGVAQSIEVTFEQDQDAPVQNVRGWYITTADGRLRWAARFDKVYDMLRRHDAVSVMALVGLSERS